MNREITIEYNSEDGYTTINSVFKRHPKVFKPIRGRFTIGQNQGYITASILDDDIDNIVCFNTNHYREETDMVRLIELK